MINFIFEDENNTQLEAFATKQNKLCITIKDGNEYLINIYLDLYDATELIKVLKSVVTNIKNDL